MSVDRVSDDAGLHVVETLLRGRTDLVILFGYDGERWEASVERAVTGEPLESGWAIVGTGVGECLYDALTTAAVNAAVVLRELEVSDE